VDKHWYSCINYKKVYFNNLYFQGTMEEKIYDRQVAKLSMSCRVVDEQQVDRHFSHSDLTELYSFTPNNSNSDKPIPNLPKVIF
jgi:transcriptional regulator ATRX